MMMYVNGELFPFSMTIMSYPPSASNSSTMALPAPSSSFVQDLVADTPEA